MRGGGRGALYVYFCLNAIFVCLCALSHVCECAAVGLGEAPTGGISLCSLRFYLLSVLPLLSPCHVAGRRDIVPHLPPESFGFYHLAQEVFQQETFSGMSSLTLCDRTGEVPGLQSVATAIGMP